MNRRSFLQAAVAAALTSYVPVPKPEVLTYHGVPIVFDGVGTTYGGIDRATYAWWRNRVVAPAFTPEEPHRAAETMIDFYLQHTPLTTSTK